MKIKALSLWEPWASLMRLGAKTIETRSWATSYRGPLLICAAKRRIPGLDLASMPVFDEMGIEFDRSRLDEILHFGKAVVIVDLVGCEEIGDPWRDEKGRLVRIDTNRPPTGSAGWRPPAEELCFGNFAPGRWAWMTRNRRVIEPFPVRGHQGLFEVELPPGVAP